MKLIQFINENFAVAISIIALASTVVSPLLTALINSYCSIRLRKLEMKHEKDLREQQYYTQHRSDVIERYITAAGKAARVRNVEAKMEFGAAMGEIYLYVDESDWPLLAEIETNILYSDKEAGTEALTNLCKKLAHSGVRTTQKITLRSRIIRLFPKSDKSKKEK